MNNENVINRITVIDPIIMSKELKIKIELTHESTEVEVTGDGKEVLAKLASLFYSHPEVKALMKMAIMAEEKFAEIEKTLNQE
jgi:hypothetical protein